MGGLPGQGQNQNEEEAQERYFASHTDKQEYYDFDYTRGQYYYNYPENHINFAPPEVQKRFFTHLITTESQVPHHLDRTSRRRFCISCWRTTQLSRT